MSVKPFSGEYAPFERNVEEVGEEDMETRGIVLMSRRAHHFD